MFHFELRVDTYHNLVGVQRARFFATRVAEYFRDHYITQQEVEYLIATPATYDGVIAHASLGSIDYFKNYLDRPMYITALNKLSLPVLMTELIKEIKYSPRRRIGNGISSSPF